MIEQIRVNVAAYAVARGDAVISTLGLGSCVAIAVHDRASAVGGLAHILLPSESMSRDRGNRANLTLARAAYSEAREIFMAHGERDKARIVAEALDQIGREMLALPSTNGKGAHASETPLNISTEGG